MNSINIILDYHQNWQNFVFFVFTWAKAPGNTRARHRVATVKRIVRVVMVMMVIMVMVMIMMVMMVMIMVDLLNFDAIVKSL